MADVSDICREWANRVLVIVLQSRQSLRFRNTFNNSVFEASKLFSTKTLLLKHYYRRQGFVFFSSGSGAEKGRRSPRRKRGGTVDAGKDYIYQRSRGGIHFQKNYIFFADLPLIRICFSNM